MAGAGQVTEGPVGQEGAGVSELQPVAAGLKAVEQSFDEHEYLDQNN